MKRILITAKHSYIGNSFAEWTNGKYDIDFISCRTDEWKQSSFSVYDAILHVAGIAHIKESKDNIKLYYEVNRDLTIELAAKAKADGVKQFIFLSSMSVYGIESGIINKDTPTNPKNNYGISKIEAENQIKLLENDHFKITTIRPPMVYGMGCKGNYSRLAKMALRLPIFPSVDNQRSMIHIDNLSEFLVLLIEDCSSGVYFPQNSEYVNTSEMVWLIAEFNGKKIRMIKLFNPLLSLLGNKIGIVNKVFGDLVYDKEMSIQKKNYCLHDLKESIRKTELG